MPANVTDYSSPTNYTAVWIHHRIDSTLQGDLNSEVPASLSQDNARLGAWTLVFNGAVHPQADEVVTVVPTATNLDESRYELGELISSKAYVKSTTINTTTTETAQGFQYVAALVGNGRNPNTAWVSGGGASITGSDIFATLTDGGTENWGIIFNGTVITGQSGTADYSGYDENGNPQFVDSSGNLYTRWRPEYVQDGATAYSVRKKLPDVTTTTTNPVTTIETSYYDFYEVQHTSASEIAAFSANVVLVIPQHIMQRNVTTAAGNMTNGSYTLDNMFIRMSPHMSAARLEQIDLYNNYGISTKLVPINFNVGADQVELSLNQIKDVSATVPADKDFLQYYSATGQWENGPAIADDILEGTTNKFYSDTKVQDYLTANAYATESYVNTTATTLIDTAISNLVDGAPAALDTLNEIAAALGDDENLAATLTSQIANLSISDLSDTTTAAPSLGESLVWDGSAWGPGAVIGGATISGTAPTAPETGEFWFDDTTTGYLYTWDNSSWVQLTGISGGGGATTLTDLGITDGTNGQVLTTDGSGGFTFTTVVSGGGAWGDITGTPTTITGYGITDAFNGAYGSLTGVPSIPTALTDLSITDGTNGQVLTTDGSGVFTFTTVVSGGGGSNAWGDITGTPTTIAGYGITDAFNGAFSSLSGKPTTITGYGITDAFNGVFSSLTGKPTTIAGYGITDGGGATTLTDLGITDGTNGQVLTTDGSAGFTFTTVGGSNAGDVGTYIFAGPNAAGGVTQNSTYAGSTLISSGFASTNAYNDNTAATITGTALSGTWKAMGNVSITSRRASTLFLRIS
tara:strand:+ start:956 stop:3370 length:2415 start_codon:yes stop_codon:yes gene_type:complete